MYRNKESSNGLDHLKNSNDLNDSNKNLGQKIKCNVYDCVHNCIDDCTCRLNEIKVCSCNNLTMERGKVHDDDTACSMYTYCGDLNVREKYNG